MVGGVKVNIVDKRLKELRQYFYIYSFFTTVIIYSVGAAMLSRDDGVIFNFQTFFAICPVVFIAVMLFGVPVAFGINRIMLKLKIKWKTIEFLVETILYLLVSIIGTFLTILLLFRDLSGLIKYVIFGEGIFLHIFAVPAAILFQLSMHFFICIHRYVLQRKYRSVS
jgi:hypothetical protein